MPTWLNPGCSKGIGLAIVQHLLEKDTSNFVIATARNINAEELTNLTKKYPQERLQLVQLDAANVDHINRIFTQVSPFLPSGLDYLVHNAGIHKQPTTPFEEMDYDLLEEELRFFTIMPIRLTRALLPLIRISKQKKILFITSILGSFTRSFPAIDQCNSYSIAKAATNMVAVKWGASLKSQGIIAVPIHPGWAKTDIGDPLIDFLAENAPELKQIETSTSAAGVVHVAEELTLDKVGVLLNYDGTVIPW